MHRIKCFSRTDRPSGFAGSPAAFGGATPDSAMDWLKAEGFASVINLLVATEEGVDLQAMLLAELLDPANVVRIARLLESGAQHLPDMFASSRRQVEKLPPAGGHRLWRRVVAQRLKAWGLTGRRAGFLVHVDLCRSRHASCAYGPKLNE